MKVLKDKLKVHWVWHSSFNIWWLLAVCGSPTLFFPFSIGSHVTKAGLYLPNAGIRVHHTCLVPPLSFPYTFSEHHESPEPKSSVRCLCRHLFCLQVPLLHPLIKHYSLIKPQDAVRLSTIFPLLYTTWCCDWEYLSITFLEYKNSYNFQGGRCNLCFCIPSHEYYFIPYKTSTAEKPRNYLEAGCGGICP